MQNDFCLNVIKFTKTTVFPNTVVIKDIDLQDLSILFLCDIVQLKIHALLKIYFI